MDARAITALLTPVLAAKGLELDDLTVTPAGKRSLLRVTVDGDGAHGRGPTLDEIAVATRAVSEALDASPATGTRPYVLEVSSRGVGRPLTRPEHWRRNRDRLVATSVAGVSLTGRVVACDDLGVTLDVDGDERRYPYADLGKATVQVEMNRTPDPRLDDVGGADDEQED